MKYFTLTIILLSATSGVFAQKDLAKDFNQKRGVAIEGYDPVSYFSDKPQQGLEKYSAEHNGVTYQFSSETNMKKFKSSPEKYEPQYGGWCAYAMGESGDKVKIDPETYKILDGKLYLFYNFRNQNTLIPWNEHENQLKKQADQYWSKIID